MFVGRRVAPADADEDAYLVDIHDRFDAVPRARSALNTPYELGDDELDGRHRSSPNGGGCS
jgi:hypothetical protein